MNTLEVQEVTKKYGDYTALDKVSLSIEPGTIFGLLGPNGAGKTTLIRIINQIIGPDEGNVLFEGQPIKRKNIEKIGYLPEERGLYKKMKVGEQLLYLSQLKGLSAGKAREEINFWMKEFDILSWWDKKVEELSKGMAQKLQFIVTVIHRPSLLILDEPFSGFDPVNAEVIKDKVLELKDQGTTIMLSTHRMESVEELCDRIALIHNSKKILSGGIDEIKQQFKDLVFEVTVEERPGANVTETDFYTIISEKKILGKDQKILRIRLSEETPPNLLLQKLMEKYEIHSFSELLPSIHDIFIKNVKNTHA